MRILRSASLLATCFVCILACVSMTLDAHAQTFGIMLECPSGHESEDKDRAPVQIDLDCPLHILDVVEEIESDSKLAAVENSTPPTLSLARNWGTARTRKSSTARSMRRWILYCAMQIDC